LTLIGKTKTSLPRSVIVVLTTTLEPDISTSRVTK
jgi:hypothetical protein